MIRFPRLSAVLVLCWALVWAGAASAGIRVSLLTVAPGQAVFQAFGHSAILVEDSDPHVRPTIYEYGEVNTHALFSSPDLMGTMTDLLEEHVLTHATRITSPIDPRFGVPYVYYRRYLADPRTERDITIDELDLAPDQAHALVAALSNDMGRTYEYKNYSDNCVTRIRDHIFEALGPAARAPFDRLIKTSLQQITMDSLDEAAGLSPTSSIVVVPGMTQGSGTAQFISMLGLTNDYKLKPHGAPVSRQFYSSLKAADARLDAFMGESAPLAQDFHQYFFRKELTEDPIPEYKSLFTPERVRIALLNTKNPATGRPVIDLSREKVVTTKGGRK